MIYEREKFMADNRKKIVLIGTGMVGMSWAVSGGEASALCLCGS